MPTVAKHLFITALASGLLLTHPAAMHAGDTWIDLNFDSVDAGTPPPTTSFQPGTINRLPQAINTTEANQIKIVQDAPGFPGKALQFIKGTPAPRTPSAVLVNLPGLAKAGKISFTWDANIESFKPSEKFPGFEALLNFTLLDSVGKPFFNLYYLVGTDQKSGVFGCFNQKLGTWAMGTKQQFEVVIDLDAATATVKIDGTEVTTNPITIAPADGLRVVQFSDGTGLASYGSLFTATLANFKMTKL